MIACKANVSVAGQSAIQKTRWLNFYVDIGFVSPRVSNYRGLLDYQYMPHSLSEQARIRQLSDCSARLL